MTPTAGQGEGAGARDGALDVLRAAMVVYIVGWWHLMAYVGDGVGHVNWVTDSITNVVLGTFTFLSGYGLGKWRGGLGASDLKQFYLRRVLRIYPLYLLALLALVAVWLVDPPTAVRAALLTSMFLPPAPMTLWFITMIMAFYVVVPLLAQPATARSVGTAACLWLAMLAYHLFIHEVDVRVLMYFPCFAAGIAMCKSGAWVRARGARLLVPLFALAFAATVLKSGHPLHDALLQIPAVVLGALSLLLLGERWLRPAGRWPLVRLLSHAGLALYLFHRPVYQLLFRIADPGTWGAQLALVLLIGFPLSIAVAIVIQGAYDRLLGWGRTRLAG